VTDRITRRELVRRGAIGGAALSLPSLLAACGAGGGGIQGGGTTNGSTTVQEKLAKTLTISNWPLYIDVDEKTKKRPTLEQFQRKYGVRVKYIEDINDNNSFFGKIQAPLREGQSIDRDIIIPTDWMAGRLVKLGWVQKLDKQAIPNAKNLDPTLAHPSWDPNREYSLPWQTYMAGIGYDPERVGKEIRSVEDLWDPKLKGKVTLLTEMPDTTGLVMLSNGDDPSHVTPKAFDAAIGIIKKQVDSGQVRQFTGNDYAPLLAKGDVWACFAWSGDIVQLQADHPGLKFVIPDAGAMSLTDTMLIPNGGDVYTASTFMNFVYDPKIMAQIEAYVTYIPPVAGTQEAITGIDASLAKNPLIFPPQSSREKLHSYDPDAADNNDYKQKFQAIAGA
jgi:spermidine/putrescine transport system substrate-binding protein